MFSWFSSLARSGQYASELADCKGGGPPEPYTSLCNLQQSKGATLDRKWSVSLLFIIISWKFWTTWQKIWQEGFAPDAQNFLEEIRVKTLPGHLSWSHTALSEFLSGSHPAEAHPDRLQTSLSATKSKGNKRITQNRAGQDRGLKEQERDANSTQPTAQEVQREKKRKSKWPTNSVSSWSIFRSL